MEREEKCLLAIKKGYKYNPETGDIIGMSGKIIKSFEKDGYIKFSLTNDKKKYQLFGHQFAWYWVHKECVLKIDHINNIRHDNRICNLRSVNNKENTYNRKDIKGYCFDKAKNKWKSTITLNDRQIHLGYYLTKEEAHNKYLKAKEKYHKF